MAGWSKDKRRVVEEEFRGFLRHVHINSKDRGRTCLGDNLFDAQERFIKGAFDALEEGVHWLNVLKSRQLGLCYDPSMRVLTADLRWVRIDELRVGDELISVEEYPRIGRGAGRKMRTSRVEAIREVFEPAFSLRMSNGVELIATGPHRHLCKARGAVHTEWRSVSKTKVGDLIRCITEPWGDSTYEDGWYGGFLDGEGSLSLPARSGAAVGVSQVAGDALERAKRYLDGRGFSYREEIDRRKPGVSSKFGTKDVHKLLTTKMSDLFRMFGLTRPSRFISKRWWEGKELPGKKSGYGWYQVGSIEPLGARRMIDIQTSEKTFICEGFVSHNSTISRAFTIFFNGIHDGLTGAVVFDTDVNRNFARREMETMILDLPKDYKFPRIKLNNRQGLTLGNNSALVFLSAGVRASKSGGTLGRSLGLSFAHMSELCSYDNDEGLEAFENSLSDENPDRFYIRESTARGFNKWHELWTEARANEAKHKCIFLGWWSKPSQKIPRTDPDFERYGTQPPTDLEMKKIQEVYDLYGCNITFEQLAWIRRKMDPNAKQEGDAPAEYTGTTTRLQEQPWTESDAFQMTGSVFFAPEKLTEQITKNVSKKFTTWMYSTGIEFMDCRIYPAPNSKSVELKVWEEPEEEAVYVVAADPAFGFNKKNDRSAIQVLRCYADGCDQVAEYAWPLINTRQFAWVIASLLGWYAGARNSAYLILEMNGPGDAVWKELESLKQQVVVGYQSQQAEDAGLRNIFRNVRNYIHLRAESFGHGARMQITTTPRLKVTMMERLKDFVTNGMLKIKSYETVDEMRSITRDGDSIAAQGSKKDDRAVALALGIRCWEDRVKKNLIAQNRTRTFEEGRKTMTVVDRARLFHSNQLSTFFASKASERTRATREARRSSWRSTRLS